MEGLVGTVLDNTYRVEQLLGQGGMGAVFRGQDVALNRPVAIKVMHSHIAQQQGFRERFMQEARAIAALDHPGIVQIYAFSRDPSLLYIVMAFIPGQNLQDWLRLLKERGMMLDLPEALAIAAQVAEALAYAHARGVYHRDIKPGNIILRPLEPGQADPYGLGFHPMLTDFGLAKLSEGGVMSMPGTSMGTPAYMAPEQCEGREIDGRADIYALGIVLYEMVTGRLPFDVQTLTEAIRAHTQEAPPPPRSVDPTLPSRVEEIILKALSKAPADRYQNAAEFKAALDAARTALSAPLETATPVPKASLSTMVGQEKPAPAPAQDRWPTPPANLAPGVQIAILQEDGTSRFYPVGSRQKVTIGRDADNDIVLNDPQISRHHAQITITEGRFQITDLNSTNGTWIGENKLLPGVAEQWRPTQSVRLGNHWLKLEGVPGTGAPVVEPAGAATYARRAAAESSDPIQVTLDPPSLKLRTGVPGVITVRLLNRQQQVDHLMPTVEGIPPEWVTLPTEPLRLAPGDTGTMTIRVQVPRSPSSSAGDHPFSVRVHSQSQQAQSVAVPGTLTIEPFRELALSLIPRTIVNAARGRVTVSNAGNATESVVLSVDDPDQVLAPSAPSAPVSVPAGAQKDVTLPISLRGKRPLMGNVESHGYSIVANAGSEQVASTQATLQIRPVLPAWAVPVLAMLLVALVAGAGLLVSNRQKQEAAQATATAQAILQATQTQETHAEREQTQVAQATASQIAMALLVSSTEEARTVTAEAKTVTAEAKTLAAAETSEAKTAQAQTAATQQAQLAFMQATADAASTAAAIANLPSPTPLPTWTPTATPTPVFGASEARGFTIPGAYVGVYKEVCLQHDNTGPSPDWYVDRVLVAGESGYIPFVFNRWIATDKADGSLMACSALPTPTPTRTLAPTKRPTLLGPTPTFSLHDVIGIIQGPGLIFQPVPGTGVLGEAMRTYDVLVVTGTDPDAGTSALVRIKLVGYSGSTDWVTLNE